MKRVRGVMNFTIKWKENALQYNINGTLTIDYFQRTANVEMRIEQIDDRMLFNKLEIDPLIEKSLIDIGFTIEKDGDNVVVIKI
jgi:hypothetical protein